jgi:hypothetical protein
MKQGRLMSEGKEICKNHKRNCSQAMLTPLDRRPPATGKKTEFVSTVSIANNPDCINKNKLIVIQ